MDSHGYKTHVENGIMKIVKGALVLMKAEKIGANLFMLKEETLQEADACVASNGEESTMMWHLKLGHMSEQGLKILFERKLLPGLKSRQFTVAYTPQQNGVAERMNRTLTERIRAMLKTAGLPNSFWAEAAKTACYIVNRSPSTAIGLKTAMEMWTEKPADYSYLHVFGCPVYVMYNAQERTKLDPKSRRCIFLGYADGVKGYRLWDPTAHKIVISRDVIFIKDQLQRRDEDDSTVKEKSETIPVYVENNPEDSDSSEAAPEHEEQEPVESEAPEVRRSTRERRPPTWHSEKKLRLYTRTRHGNLYHYHTEEKPLETNGSTRSNVMAMTKWSVRLTTVRVVLAMCATFDLHLEQLDVKTAFLHGELEEEIYMLQPEGFAEIGKENLVCRLNKSLYGLKQAPRCWYQRFDSFIMSLGYNRLSSDHCAYYKRFEDNYFIILLLYVDDMLVAGPNKDRVQELKAQLAREFEMKDLGPANKILGMQIHRDRNNRKIWLSQKNYLKKILWRFNMQDCKSISTPLPVNFKLSSSMCPSNEAERKEMSRVPYASAVGSLMFAMICTRPDITQAVGVVSRYMANPGGEHWIAVKRILRYIRGTSDVALCYGGSEFTVKGYVDSDFAGDLDKRKSTTGFVFTLAGAAVSWVSKLQTVVALSTTEAEYMTATQACKEAIWIQRLLEELGHKQQKIPVFCDSQSALHIARNPAFHYRTKHIGVQYHFVREVVEDGSVDL
ncbi:Integrase catalytic domain-containing protein [Citrus sinensis]|uniref:Integrase catalytic domain-containing protein n=1 Tax=Citrus sinensis TaxID=2711 RepID=A0ACB8HVS1_CITSI|nr:Integrase catalytic domain-containing protein [Citrus sinensis]